MQTLLSRKRYLLKGMTFEVMPSIFTAPSSFSLQGTVRKYHGRERKRESVFFTWTKVTRTLINENEWISLQPSP